jgi:CRISPR-associated endoribonuclease Cas6
MIRSFDENFIKSIQFALQSARLDFDVLSIGMRVLNIPFVHQVQNITPTIITLPNTNNKDNKRIVYWTKKDDLNIEIVRSGIKNNLEKKYQQFFGQSIEASSDFITLITPKNHKPIFYTGRNKIPFVGNNFEIVFGNDTNSQKLAKLAMAVGIGEKNSFGFGMIRGVG